MAIRGRLRKYHSNYYYVDVDGVLYECFLKGLLKKALKSGGDKSANTLTELVVGDWVTLDSVDDNNQTARIMDVEPRLNTLARPKIANIDQVMVVYPLKQPEFDPHLLDRYLAHIALAGIPACICISKADLAESETELGAIRKLYEKMLGYPVHTVSVYQRDSLNPVADSISGKVTVLAGPSGAGKSSLMNALQPDLQLRVSEVSQKIERGQHTTRHVELLPLNLPGKHPNTFVADTPGFSHLKFDYALPADIAKTFPEFNSAQCIFSDCLHLAPVSDTSDSHGDEETEAPQLGCAFLSEGSFQLDESRITASRYASYVDILQEASAYKQEASKSSQKREYGFKQVSNKGKQGLSILKLKEKNREASRRTQRQTDWTRHIDASGDENDGDTDE